MFVYHQVVYDIYFDIFMLMSFMGVMFLEYIVSIKRSAANAKIEVIAEKIMYMI